MNTLKLVPPEEIARLVRIGTCSWKYESWTGLLYPEGQRLSPDDYLVHYARRLKTVEVDQWFWSLFPSGVRLPDPRTVTAYAAEVPDDFEFTIKAPNSLTLTHYYQRQSAQYREFAGRENEHFLSVDLGLRFLDSLAPLGSKVGPVMFQFEYLNKKKMPSKSPFLQKLHDFFTHLPPTYRYAIECRNPAYLDAEYFAFLREHRLGFVFLDGYYMPPMSAVFPKFDIVTSDHVIIRLHGPDRGKIEAETGSNWDRRIDPHEDRLQAVVGLLDHTISRGVRTYVNVNNHYEGSAPRTIDRLVSLLEETRGQSK